MVIKAPKVMPVLKARPARSVPRDQMVRRARMVHKAPKVMLALKAHKARMAIPHR